jgi:hypothetical protein
VPDRSQLVLVAIEGSQRVGDLLVGDLGALAALIRVDQPVQSWLVERYNAGGRRSR